MAFPRSGRPLDDAVRQRHVTRFPYAVVLRLKREVALMDILNDRSR